MPPQGQNGDHRVGLKEILGKKYYSMLNVRSPFSRLNIGFPTSRSRLRVAYLPLELENFLAVSPKLSDFDTRLLCFLLKIDFKEEAWWWDHTSSDSYVFLGSNSQLVSSS